MNAWNRSAWVILLPLLLTAMACGGEQTPAPSPQAADPAPTAAADIPPAMPGAKLNLNTATEEALLALPNVGDRMVHEFLEYRPYVSIRQFRREIGKYVDDEQVAAYEQYLYVPIDPNESDAETLQQLPGVDAAAAEDLIAGRPYASKAAFLEKLTAHVTEDERGVAETYLNTP